MTERTGPKLSARQVLLAIIALSCLNYVLETNGADSQIPVKVSRRDSGDVITFSSEDQETCTGLTYVVGERQCVRDQELLNGMHIV